MRNLFGSPVRVTNILNSSRKTLANRVYFRTNVNGIACKAKSSIVIGVKRRTITTPRKLIASIKFSTLNGICCTFRNGVRYAKTAVG